MLQNPADGERYILHCASHSILPVGVVASSRQVGRFCSHTARYVTTRE
ncbi:hypothetical protein CU044_1179 [Streptomyces sp. L-9-10]|nr:hypothetical protein CU044_1179 [Streptomyces sp. L-9-10]